MQNAERSEGASVTLVDGHVHLRSRFNVSEILSAAVENFDAIAARTADVHAVLLLAEAVGEESFARLAAHDRPVGRWRFDESDERCVLDAERDDGRRLAIVNGRQWTCDNKLEVLTMGGDLRLRDGMPLEACIEAGLGEGALVVLPWGFGKWTGERRRRVIAAIDRFGSSLVIGDSAARPGRSDAVLEHARGGGLPVLPGTDPLPISPHRRRIGRYGLQLAGSPPRTGRRAWLESQIRSSQPGTRTIGSRDSLPAAIATQLRLRLG
ncbi:MAG: hypothetical protein AAF937_07625 [Planctomycetota bacterium]